MADNKKKRGGSDRALIALGESYEVAYWSKKFKITPAKLKYAVKKVGHSARKVEAYIQLQKHKAADKRLIALSQPYEVRYWSKKFKVTPAKLKAPWPRSGIRRRRSATISPRRRPGRRPRRPQEKHQEKHRENGEKTPKKTSAKAAEGGEALVSAALGSGKPSVCRQTSAPTVQARINQGGGLRRSGLGRRSVTASAERGATGVIDRAGATISTRSFVAYCGRPARPSTPSGVITVSAPSRSSAPSRCRYCSRRAMSDDATRATMAPSPGPCDARQHDLLLIAAGLRSVAQIASDETGRIEMDMATRAAAKQRQ